MPAGPRPRCFQGGVLPGPFGFWRPSAIPGTPRLRPHMAFSLCLCPNVPLSIRTPVTGLGLPKPTGTSAQLGHSYRHSTSKQGHVHRLQGDINLVGTLPGTGQPHRLLHRWKPPSSSHERGLGGHTDPLLQAGCDSGSRLAPPVRGVAGQGRTGEGEAPRAWERRQCALTSKSQAFFFGWGQRSPFTIS